MPHNYIALPTIERLNEVFHLNRETGELTWKPRDGEKSWNAKYAGKIAGCTRKDTGYRVVAVDDRLYRAHRIIWKMVNGRDPIAEIDHRNLSKGTNAPDNLREATSAQNKMNRPVMVTNKSGLKGAHYVKRRGDYMAAISVKGRQRYLGYFPTAQEAHDAYVAAAREIHGDFARG